MGGSGRPSVWYGAGAESRLFPTAPGSVDHPPVAPACRDRHCRVLAVVQSFIFLKIRSGMFRMIVMMTHQIGRT
jgi:hypothetical protein